MKRKIYQGRAIQLFVEEVSLPNGKTTTLDIIRHPGASAVVPLLPNGHVVLVYQYRYAASGYLYEIPAGKLDPGENPEHCALRETEEETGFRVGVLKRLTTIFTAPGFCDEQIHLYLGTDLTPCPQRLDEDEVLKVIPLPLEEAIEKIETGGIVDAKSIIALQLAYAHLKRGDAG